MLALQILEVLVPPSAPTPVPDPDSAAGPIPVPTPEPLTGSLSLIHYRNYRFGVSENV